MSSDQQAQQIMRAPGGQLVLGGAESVSAVPAGPEGLSFADFGRVLKQHKLLILIAFCALYALVVAATAIVWRWFPAYSAQALLLLRPPTGEVFKVGSDQLVNPQIMETLLATEAQRIGRWDTLQDVLKLPEIKQTAFFRWYGGDFEKCIYDLRDLLHVSPMRDTQLISVSLSIRDPQEAVDLVDAIVKRYVDWYKSDTEVKERQLLQDLKVTQNEVAAELQRKHQELANFRAQTDVGALESEKETNGRAIADQQYVVTSYQARVADLEAQLQSVEGVDPRNLPITPEDRVIVEADPILRMYRQQVESLDVEIKVAQSHVAGPNSRWFKMMQTRREGYSENESARRQELLNDLRERKVDGLRQEVARVRAVQTQTQETLSAMQTRQADLDSKQLSYESMVKDEERLDKQLEMIGTAMLERQHLVAAEPKAARLSIAQSPRKAVEPSRPNLIMWLGGGLVLALGGAVGLAFLRELTDKAVRTPIDVARHGRLSVLGSIPQLTDEQADVDQIELATRSAPQSLVAEAFRQVRANLVFSGPVESQRVLLITSPGPSNGKTAVAINLAVTLAQGNQRVLLVDSNFRRPAIREAFAGTRSDGLSNVLIGQARLEDLITPTDVPNLSVLTSGPMPPTPADLLGPTYMRPLLEQLRAKYDRVIFDGPPALLISDGLVLATQVDGVIVVARAVGNSKGALRRAREQLDKVNAHVVGAVLNGVQARAGGYYRNMYREFYDYSSDETIPRELPGAPASDDDSTAT